MFYVRNCLFLLVTLSGRRGWLGCLLHWYPNFCNKVFLIRWLNNFRDFYWILIGWFIKLNVQTFQPLIVIYRRGSFVYHHWECTSIYQSLSYPFRSVKDSYFLDIILYFFSMEFFLIIILIPLGRLSFSHTWSVFLGCLTILFKIG